MFGELPDGHTFLSDVVILARTTVTKQKYRRVKSGKEGGRGRDGRTCGNKQRHSRDTMIQNQGTGNLIKYNVTAEMRLLLSLSFSAGSL